MNAESVMANELAALASRFQHDRTGHKPKAVTIVLSEDTLVVTLHDALTPAELALARNPQGAARIQEFHRQLFASSTDEMQSEIHRITGRRVREAAAEIEPATGAVVHAFTTGAMVQVFQLTQNQDPSLRADSDSQARANNEGMRMPRTETYGHGKPTEETTK